MCHPLENRQGASSSKGIDKEFGGLGQEAIQKFWTFLAGLKRFNPQKKSILGRTYFRDIGQTFSVIPTLFAFRSE